MGNQADVLRPVDWSATTTVHQAMIEAELTAVIGAGPHERTEARTAQRNGSRPRTLTTIAADLELRIPKCGPGRSSRRRWSGGGSISGLAGRQPAGAVAVGLRAGRWPGSCR